MAMDNIKILETPRCLAAIGKRDPAPFIEQEPPRVKAKHALLLIFVPFVVGSVNVYLVLQPFELLLQYMNRCSHPTYLGQITISKQTDTHYSFPPPALSATPEVSMTLLGQQIIF